MTAITTPGNSPQNRTSTEIVRAGEPSDQAAPTGQKPRRTVNSARRAAAGKAKVKPEKPKLMTPVEYAQHVLSDERKAKLHKTDHLSGRCIFYAGGDYQYASESTRGKMEYIVKHGGTLAPTFDPEVVTYIITDTTARPTLRALGLKSLTEIPQHIPTVKWSWAISVVSRAQKAADHVPNQILQREDTLINFDFMHAAFAERIDAGSGWQKITSGRAKGGAALQRLKKEEDKGKSKSDVGEGGPSNGDLSIISCPGTVVPSTHDNPSVDASEKIDPSGSLDPPGDEKSNDPLAEFYAEAKAEQDAGDTHNRDKDETEDEASPVKAKPAKRGWTCDKKEPQLPTKECANQDVVDALEQLMELHKAKSSEDDRWRVFSYGKCIRALKNHPKRIKSLSQARAIRGVGEKTAMKIMEIIETGGLKRIQYENTEDVEATKIFQGIYGVGRNTAFAWYANGCRTLDDIKMCKGGIKVSAVQEIGIKFYDDINTRIPRAEVQEIFDRIKSVALDMDPKLFIEVMGSFRRGKADCGDIDVLITRDTADGKTHAGFLSKLLDELHELDILTEDLSVPDDYSDLELCYRGLCMLPGLPGARRRRIDILCVPWECRGGALLYYTGDDIFNRAMRMKANVLGYSLNQRGLYAGVVRDPKDRRVKLHGGSIIASETEEEIFKVLGVPWQEPHERVRG
ncbi:hypothetical protein CONPUDRAFT_63239 [Coniophora puteana RWD-64-598 SS2]|uniref:DNA polymerase n=1 Tax=Coniophora puteana (strain RWD-64-598) TaxID=741705 RepID=A0A5M3MD49_CONPW|nr:uncharacterized protein CONPUDRAFT_63239 [Coniophora puteana RWD-64-598 SS2]EIW76555.1 hypothetical protein CONPUDRAFT_63239 [Coniophora puteana RWD-64-598 SS2]